MIAWLLLGPTGVGKSHWGKELARQEDIPFVFVDLDEWIATPEAGAEAFLLQHGWAQFWARSYQGIEALAHDANQRYLVAIGAGTQMASVLMGQTMCLYQPYPALTLWCEPDILLKRLRHFRQDMRTREQLINLEFNAERLQLYHQAQAFLDVTTLSEQQCFSALKALIYPDG